MARTQVEIFGQITNRIIETMPQLSNPSKTAIWRLIAWVIANAIHSLELIFDSFRLEIDETVVGAQVGNAAWYRNQVLLFQYGDEMSFIGTKYMYASIDAEKMIVKKCAIEERNDGSIRIKVAKDMNGNLASLNTDEVNALISYVKKIRFAGVRFQIFTNNGDILKIFATVYYDAIVPVAIVKRNVDATIKAYIQNLPFNGQLQLSLLVDAIQQLKGVSDIVITSAASKFSNQDSYINIERTVVAIGGYFNISTASGETLDDTITYQLA